MSAILEMALRAIITTPFENIKDVEQLHQTIDTMKHLATEAIKEDRAYQARLSETNCYRARRLYAYRHIEALCKIVENLGVESDPPKDLPIPDHEMPTPPPDLVKNEIQNQLRATLRLILAHNDGCLSKQTMQQW